jgi:citrate lyase subunit beta/citryl-CoA lyase
VTARSWLFVPGDSAAKMEKALNAGADALILDLEDSVGEQAKGDARDTVAQFLERQATAGGPKLWVRINPISGSHADADLAVVIKAKPAGIVLPKPDSADDVKRLGDRLAALEPAAGLPGGSVRILPLATETPISIFRLDGYVSVGPRLAGLTWGAEDLSAAVGAVTSRTEAGAFTPLYDLARSLCLAGAAAADVAAIETVYPDFRDLDGLAAYAARGRRDGFVGMMAIHPTQVAVINDAFTPSPSEIEQARRIVDAFASNPKAGTLSLNGVMLDGPHLKQARRVLERAREADQRR